MTDGERWTLQRAAELVEGAATVVAAPFPYQFTTGPKHTPTTAYLMTRDDLVNFARRCFKVAMENWEPR